MSPGKGNELRCFCGRQPLLATYGYEKGQLYVHVLIYKQRRIFGEVIAYGPVKLRCRECLRWHMVVIRQPGRAVLQEVTDILPSG